MIGDASLPVEWKKKGEEEEKEDGDEQSMILQFSKNH